MLGYFLKVFSSIIGLRIKDFGRLTPTDGTFESALGKARGGISPLVDFRFAIAAFGAEGSRVNDDGLPITRFGFIAVAIETYFKQKQYPKIWR